MESAKVRVDKWLWAVRVFKTRTQASKACQGGKVKIADMPVKASRLIVPGDEITVKRKNITRILRVVQCIEKRVNAEKAALCYKDITPPGLNPELRKLPSAFYSGSDMRPPGAGRPTKKERRALQKFKFKYRERDD